MTAKLVLNLRGLKPSEDVSSTVHSNVELYEIPTNRRGISNLHGTGGQSKWQLEERSFGKDTGAFRTKSLRRVGQDWVTASLNSKTIDKLKKRSWPENKSYDREDMFRHRFELGEGASAKPVTFEVHVDVDVEIQEDWGRINGDDRQSKSGSSCGEDWDVKQ